MAYYNPTLADILNALGEGQSQPNASQSRQQPQRPAAAAPQPQPSAAPFNFFPFYEDEDDEGYYPSYYRQQFDPYSGGFFPPNGRTYGSNPRAQQQARARAQQQRQAAQAAQAAQVAEQSAPQQQQPLDFFDLLSQLAGTDVRNLVDPSKSKDEDGDEELYDAKSEEPKAEAKEEEQQQPEAAEPSTKEASKPTPAPVPAPVPAATSVPKPTPVLRRHSTFASKNKEPQPKVEISQRNTANPTLPYTPQTNVYSTENEYVAILAISGASLNNLDIDFHPSTNEIVVKGEIEDPVAGLFNDSSKKPSLKISEVRTGSIERRIKFPNLPKINDDEIKAKYVNGLLSIRIPKIIEEGETKPKIRKVTIEDVPDEELVYEENAGYKN